MNLTDDITLKCMKGSPILLDDICAIYPPNMGEIIDLGYETFLQYVSIMTFTKPVSEAGTASEFNKITENMSNFNYFLLMVNLDADANKRAHDAFYFFIHEDVIFSFDPPQIIIGPIDEKHIIDEDAYVNLQTVIKRACFMNIGEKEIIFNDNDNERVKALKKQFLKNRERVAQAKKRKQQRTESELSFSDLVGSVCVGDCGLNMENVWNITYYAFQDQLRRMGWRDQFNINNRAAMAGAKLKKSQLQHWIKSISSEDKAEK